MGNTASAGPPGGDRAQPRVEMEPPGGLPAVPTPDGAHQRPGLDEHRGAQGTSAGEVQPAHETADTATVTVTDERSARRVIDAVGLARLIQAPGARGEPMRRIAHARETGPI